MLAVGGLWAMGLPLAISNMWVGTVNRGNLQGAVFQCSPSGILFNDLDASGGHGTSFDLDLAGPIYPIPLISLIWRNRYPALTENPESLGSVQIRPGGGLMPEGIFRLEEFHSA
ncbi:hypothetical protein VTN02DRAFT_5664 [Thermoascus thermophilus]